MSEETKLIIVIGPTGSGKTSFINAILGKESQEKDHADPSPCPEAVPEIVGYGPFYTSDGTLKVELVDTPGFDAHSTEILAKIGEYINEKGQSVSGIIFLHSIIGDVCKKMSRKDITTLKKMCGSDSMENVVVVTTFWDSVMSNEEGMKYETEALSHDEGMLKVLHDTKGIRFYRWGLFEDGDERKNDEGFLPPRSIVDRLLSLEPVQLSADGEEDRTEPTDIPTIGVDTGSDPVEDIQEPEYEIQHQLDAGVYHPGGGPLKEEHHYHNFDENNTASGHTSSIPEESSEDGSWESGNREGVTRNHLAEISRIIEELLSNVDDDDITLLVERKFNTQPVHVTPLRKVEKKQDTLSTECRALCTAVQKSMDGVNDLCTSLTAHVGLAEQNETLRSELAKANEEHSRALREIGRERDALASECRTLRTDAQNLRGELDASRTSLESRINQNTWDRAEISKELARVVAENGGLRWAITNLSKDAPRRFSLD